VFEYYFQLANYLQNKPQPFCHLQKNCVEKLLMFFAKVDYKGFFLNVNFQLLLIGADLFFCSGFFFALVVA
jgi:hypothetical protein